MGFSLGGILGGAGSGAAAGSSFGPWGAVAGAAIGAAGSYMTAKENNNSAKSMAANAMQTRVADMRKAGLNPVLAATNGGLQAASVPQLQAGDLATPISNGVNSAISAHNADTNAKNASTSRMQAENQQRAIDAQIALNTTQSAKNLADADVARNQMNVQNANKDLLTQQIITEASRRASFDSAAGLSSAQAARTKYQAVEDRVRAEYLNSPTGAESARVGFDNKAGGMVGIINTGLSSFNRDLRARNSHSAKAVKEAVRPTRRLKPNKYQQQLINQYGGR